MVLCTGSYAGCNYGNVNVSKVVGGYWISVRYQLVSDRATVRIRRYLTIESGRIFVLFINNQSDITVCITQMFANDTNFFHQWQIQRIGKSSKTTFTINMLGLTMTASF